VHAEQVRRLLEEIAARKVSVEEGVARLRSLPFEELGYATVDHHRGVRCGHPEVIFCQGKTVEQVLGIARRLSSSGGSVLATRATSEQLAAIQSQFRKAIVNEPARVALVNARDQVAPRDGAVAVVSAGTADSSVAEEALLTLRSMAVPAHRIADVGVSGLHRLLGHVPTLQNCCAIVVIAGMEGALPSVVAGLVGCPVFAVPTSVGYGASFGGVAALLGMLNSCASNVTVVNIDNGFGAAFAAGLVWQQIERFGRRDK
jgi:pyridinium-3,5-biscarboxylic acid mononucleotide synthase